MPSNILTVKPVLTKISSLNNNFDWSDMEVSVESSSNQTAQMKTKSNASELVFTVDNYKNKFS